MSTLDIHLVYRVALEQFERETWDAPRKGRTDKSRCFPCLANISIGVFLWRIAQMVDMAAVREKWMELYVRRPEIKSFYNGLTPGEQQFMQLEGFFKEKLRDDEKYKIIQGYLSDQVDIQLLRETLQNDLKKAVKARESVRNLLELAEAILELADAPREIFAALESMSESEEYIVFANICSAVATIDNQQEY